MQNHILFYMGLREAPAPRETGVQDAPCLCPQFSLCWLGWLWIFAEMAQGVAEGISSQSRPPVSFSFCSLACGTPASMSVPGENVSVPG